MNKTEKAYQLTLGFYGLLLSLMVVESILFQPVNAAVGALLIWLGAKLLPLLAFLPGLLKRQLTSIIWLCFVLLVYFCVAVLQSFDPDLAGRFALLRCGLLTGLFLAAIYFVRWSGKAAD